MPQFDKNNLPETGVSVIKFYSDTCAPCKLLTEDLLNLVGAEVTPVNIMDDMDAAMEYGIRNVPTTLIFKGKDLITKIVGRNFEAIQEKVTELQ